MTRILSTLAELACIGAFLVFIAEMAI